jgi:hypothetical protein
MARFIPSAFLSGIKGKVGNTVFQANSAGHIIRTVGNSRKTRSQSQKNMNVHLSALYTTWLFLTAAQQTSWKNFAIFANLVMKNNPSKIISGWNCFLKINMPRILYGNTILTDPLSSNTLPAAANAYLTLVAPHLYVQFSRIIDDSVEFFVISATPPLSLGKTYDSKNYRRLIVGTRYANSFDITTQYVAMFGALPTTGQILGLKYSIVSLLSGLQLPFNYVQTIL